jgi:biotin carboxyl carrier protein
MKYIVEVEGAQHEIEVLPDRFVVDGRQVEVDARRIGDLPLYSLLVDSQSVEVSVEADGRYQYRVMFGGELYTVLVQPAARLSLTGAPRPQASDTVRAPMPGLVASIPVALGQAVKAGAILVVLESMKMENPLLAPADAVVQQLHVTSRQSVEKGQPLVTLAFRDEAPAGGNSDANHGGNSNV